MGNTISRQLIEKYLSNTCSEKEKALVEGWYNQLLSQDISIDAEHLDEVQAAIWQELKAHVTPAPTPVRRMITWRKIAAAASILVVLAAGAHYFIYDVHKSPSPAAQQTITAPVKVNNLVELPDGSIVILDKGSTIDFPKSFEGSKTREVTLHGHAYFDVTHKQEQPFIVKAGRLTTTVLGTTFDINTRNQEVSVRVITGKVKVATGRKTLGSLEPDHQLTYTESTGLSSIGKVNAAEQEDWAIGDVQFNNITFEAICHQLQKRYHVTIIIKDAALKNKKLTITLTTRDDLKSTLATVCDFNGATYVYNTTDSAYLVTTLH